MYLFAGIQAYVCPTSSDIATQTDAWPDSTDIHVCCHHKDVAPSKTAVQAEPHDNVAEPSSPMAQDDSDDDYVLSSDEESGSTTSDISETANILVSEVYNDTKYIVFRSSLMKLLRLVHCSQCGEMALGVTTQTKGTCLLVVLDCQSCHHKTRWNSQPYVGSTPAGNIMLSASILSAGAIPSKVMKVMGHMKVATITARSFSRHQRLILFPCIKATWKEQQDWLLASLQAKDRDLVLAGDGRCDSPGHSAKYGSYTILELLANVIIDMQLVQVGFMIYDTVNHNFKFFVYMSKRNPFSIKFKSLDFSAMRLPIPMPWRKRG